MKDLLLQNTDGNQNWMSPMDIQRTGNGLVATVSDLQLLDQMVSKALVTIFGSNSIRPLYGAAFVSMIGKKLTQALSGLLIVTETARVVNRVSTITQQNTLNLTPNQIISSIKDILINNQTTGQDPRIIIVMIEINTQSGNSQKIQLPVSLIPTPSQ